MKTNFLYIACVLLILQGCASFSPAMSGLYQASNGDVIRIEDNGDLYLSSPSYSEDQFQYIGRVHGDTKADVSSYLMMSSNSRFVTTTIIYDNGYNSISMEWSSKLPDSAKAIATNYSRANPNL